MAAEIERGLISARTMEAFRARRTFSLPVGRSKDNGKSNLDKHRPEIEALFANMSTQQLIAKRYNSSPACQPRKDEEAQNHETRVVISCGRFG